MPIIEPRPGLVPLVPRLAVEDAGRRQAEDESEAGGARFAGGGACLRAGRDLGAGVDGPAHDELDSLVRTPVCSSGPWAAGVPNDLSSDEGPFLRRRAHLDQDIIGQIGEERKSFY